MHKLRILRIPAWTFLLILTVGVIVEGGANESDDGASNIQITIHALVPDLQVVSFAGMFITAFPHEYTLLREMRDFESSIPKCDIHITMENKGNSSYMLSDADFRAVLTGLRLKTNEGQVWQLTNTFSRVHAESVAYNLPLIAGSRKTFVYPVMLSRLSPVGHEEGNQVEFPPRLHYAVAAEAGVMARLIAGREFGEAIRVTIEGSGVLSVCPHGAE